MSEITSDCSSQVLAFQLEEMQFTALLSVLRQEHVLRATLKVMKLREFIWFNAADERDLVC